MRSPLALFSWRHNRRHPLRIFLSLMSITLGVALFVSMQVAQESAVSAFESAARRAAGRTEFTVSGRDRIGVDAAALARVESVPGVVAAPVLRLSASLPDLQAGAILLVGVDLLREARLRDFAAAGETDLEPIRFLTDRDAVLLAEPFARRHGLSIGSTLRLSTPGHAQQLTVAGLLAPRGPAAALGGNLAVMRIESVARLFGRGDRLDRIDVAGTDGPLDAAAVARLRAALGDAYRLEPFRARSSMLDVVLSRLEALVAVSIIALLVGLFIIYLSVSIGVVERARDIGTLRAIGASRGQIQALLLTEAGILGVAGSALGIVLGYLLALGLVRMTVRSVNVLVHVVEVDTVVMSFGSAAAAAAAGILTSLAAAYIPARRATRISPLEALRPAIRGFRMAPDVGRSSRIGLALGGAGIIGVLGFYQHVPPNAGLLLTSLVFVGVALTLPRVTMWLAWLARPTLRRRLRVEGDLAADNILQYPQRTALTVTALAGAIAMMVATAATLLSFQVAVTGWLERNLPFDLAVWPASVSRSIYSDEALPWELAEKVRAVEGVADTYGLRIRMQPFAGSEVLLVGLDFDGFLAAQKRKQIAPVGRVDDRKQMAAFARGEAIGVSENFAVLNGLALGDTLELVTASGPRRYAIAWVLEDYSYPLGVIFMNLDAYAVQWRDRTLSYVDVMLAPGADRETVRARIGDQVGPAHGAIVFRTEDIAAYGAAALEQSFSLTYVQVIISMVIGFFGIVNTLLISVLSRTREIGLLRSVGMTRAQVARTVVVEALFIAAVGGVLGAVSGMVAAAVPVANHVTRLTGFVLPLAVPWGTIGFALVVAMVIGFTASLIPARRAAATNVLEAVGYE